MLAISTTIVLIAFTSLVSAQTLQHIENNKICSAWQYATGASVHIETSLCSGALGYELSTHQNVLTVRFCCPHLAVVEPEVGPAPTSCGRQAVTPIRTRIVGGQEAIPHSWPWLVSLQYGGNHFCGGTLIDRYHVLTAAHCLQDSSIFNADFTVVAGLHAKSRLNPQRIQRKQVAGHINHPAYNEVTNQNDVAIIRLASPITITSYVNVACLPERDPVVNENVMIAGWGTIKFEGSAPDALRQANIQIMDNCRYVYDYDNAKQLCAGTKDYKKDSCQGDSGGPLMYESNGNWMVAGVVSYGDECAKENSPGVYARVSYYLPWIRSVTGSLSGK